MPLLPVSSISSLLTDVIHGAKALLRRPRSSVATLTILTLGIGLPTTVASIAEGILLRGLPVPDGERFITITTAPGYDAPMPHEDFLTLTENQSALAEMAAYRPPFNTVLTSPERGSKGLPGTYVTGNLFRMLGVEPVIGRNFRPEDEDPASPPVAMISHGVWQALFGGDRDVIGQTVVVNREPMTLVGVMPPDFRFPVNQEVWSVLRWSGRPWSEDPVFAIGKLRTNSDAEDAAARLAPLVASLDEELPLPEPRQLHVLPFIEAQLPPEVPRSLTLLFWVVAVTLVLSCANAATLQLSDYLGRAHHFWVRRAFGARTPQLLRLLLAEISIFIALAACAGIGLAWALLRLVSRSLLETSLVGRYFWVDIRLEPSTYVVALGLAAIALIFSGLLPALWFLRGHRLRSEPRATEGPGAVRLGSFLVAAQVAVCFALLASSALLVSSALSLLSREPSFDQQQLVRTLITTYQANLETPEARQAFWNALLSRLSEVPEIAGATVSSGVPWGPSLGARRAPVTTGSPGGSSIRELPHAEMFYVLPGFLRTLDLPVLSGRGLGQNDMSLADADPLLELPVVVSASFARRHFETSALGRTFSLYPSFRSSTPTSARVVGVVADRGLGRSDRAYSEDAIYAPFSIRKRGGGFLIVRGRTGAAEVMRRIEREIARIEPRVATLAARTYEREEAEEVWIQRRLSELCSFFALAALILSAGGLFAVIALSLKRRHKEVAVRAALGATPSKLRRLLIVEGGTWIGFGLLAGLGLFWVGQHLVIGFLYEVKPWDPWLTGGAALLTLAVLLPVIVGPAERAAQTNPAQSLTFY